MAHGGVHAEASPAERDDIDDMEWWHGWDSTGGYDRTTYGVRFGGAAYGLVLEKHKLQLVLTVIQR